MRLPDPAAGPRPSPAGVHVATAPAQPSDRPDQLADDATAALEPGSFLVDRAAAIVDGRPAVRTLVVAMGAGGAVAVVVEQWRLVAHGHRVVLTATADLASWAAVGEVLRTAVAEAGIAP